MAEDPFEDLLSLEDQFYHEGYQLGLADGQQRGLGEGRAFGLEKGFEKYRAIGKVRGRSLVWASRLKSEPLYDQLVSGGENGAQRSDDSPSPQTEHLLPALPQNSRLPKHIRFLLSITDPSEISTANTEDAVDDFEERLKKAEAKVQIVEKIIGETSSFDGEESRDDPVTGKNENLNEEGKQGAEGDIEDLAALGTRG